MTRLSSTNQFSSKQGLTRSNGRCMDRGAVKSPRWSRWLAAAMAFLACVPGAAAIAADEAKLHLTLHRERPETQGSDNYVDVRRDESWPAAKTAVIVCDMWDSHHCYRAVQRENQMVPRMNEVLKTLRNHGVTIIHAPSSCMDFYQDHPARKRVAQVPQTKAPPEINQWCYSIPAEEQATYPLDQSDGGEDDTPEEHAAWEQTLREQGRDVRAPWKRQHPGLAIDADRDYITDRGDEVWNILEARGIDHVILMGVHTNMCVLGRPFGLRQMAKNGKHVVLMEDLTDSMYNPKAWPYVSHQQGTELIISHIRRYVCPTITSDQVIGGQRFTFQPIDDSPATPGSPDS